VADTDPAREGVITLTYIYRTGCHLCEAMWSELDGIRSSGVVQFDCIDLACESHLEERYGDRIPLLFHGELELARYFLDPDRLDSYLAELDQAG
jgi:hypothetical protein